MGKSAERKEIYLDLFKLAKELRMAGYEMEKHHRIDYLLPFEKAVRECLRAFVRCYRKNEPQEKFKMLEALEDEFAILLMEFRLADEEHIWRGKKDEFGNCKCVKRIVDIVAKIDEGICRWKNNMVKGRTAPEIEDAAK